jgi:hypothetical protein
MIDPIMASKLRQLHSGKTAQITRRLLEPFWMVFRLLGFPAGFRQVSR